MYTDVQASGSIQVVSSTISTAGTSMGLHAGFEELVTTARSAEK